MAFSYYKTVTIDHTKVPSTQSNFPVLVSVTDADLKTVGNGGYVQNSSGYDVGFYSDSALTTKLDWETERYIASTGEVIYWVRISSVSSSSDTVFYMAFGDSGISTDQSNKTGVWDSNYKEVMHLADGTTLSVTDSTGNSNTGTNNSAAATTGKVDGAASFNGSSAYISLPNGFASNFSGGKFTLSAWVYANSLPTWGTIIKNWGESAGGAFHFGLYSSDGTLDLFVSNSGGSAANTNEGATFPTGSFQHVVAVADGSFIRLYRNGSAVGSPTAYDGTLLTSFTYTNIAAKPSDTGGAAGAAAGYWDGKIDEIRISDSARSADWITAEYNNQNSPGTFESFGSRTAVSGGGSTNFLQLMKTRHVDALTGGFNGFH
jgi:hypothetical protein